MVRIPVKMRIVSVRVALSFLVGLLLASPGMMAGVGSPGGMVLTSAGPMEGPSPDPAWTDDLQDTSHVYVPDGGLVGVEVAGGEARLLPGEDDGWLASEVITCPPGYRYDLVFLEVELPGGSYVEVALLNASDESSVVGYANETIPPYVGLREMPINLYGLDPSDFPEVRVQVNLHASGTDRPVLRSWSLTFIDEEEWRDDLLGTTKLLDARRLNVTGGQATLDLANFGASTAWYDPFPPIIFTRTSQPSNFDVFYPNATREAYQDATAVGCTGSLGVQAADLNDDGFLDLVCANSPHGGQDKDSQIYWGRASGTWSPAGATNLATVGAERVTTGDFDGDGDTDVLITCLRTSATVDTVVFLNRDGSFNRQPDTVLVQNDPREAAAGDLDGDGFDDIVLAEDGSSRCFLGGAGGPDTTADITFAVGGNCDEVKLRDLDDDGYLDVMFATLRSGKALVFTGGPSGPDNVADYSLSVPGTRCYGCGSGDLNGDGYTDLVFTASTGVMRVFEGTASGWSDASYHDVTGPGASRVVDMLDIDHDGYDDLITGAGGKFEIFLGGITWPTAADVSKDIGTTTPPDMAIVVPARGVGRFRGVMTTEDLTLPSGKKWDILNLEAQTPANTSVSVTVLDSAGKGIPGFVDRTETDLDLSGILPDRHRTIRVRVTLESELNDTTPVMDLIRVRWQDLGTWRDEFYGPAKIDRQLNLAVSERRLGVAGTGMTGPHLVFSSLKSDGGYDTTGLAFWDDGSLGYLSSASLPPETRVSTAVTAGDVDDDGLLDLVFAVHRTSDTTFSASSPLLLGTPVGVPSEPQHEFSTTGAADVLLSDLNDDGHEDVVFAQEMSGPDDYAVNSTLFWGSEDGFADEPDVEFSTRGASGVTAADLDGDGDLDLAFACFRDLSMNADSMVFLQDGTDGFCGTLPDHRLPTHGARAVAAGDLDGDHRMDLVFANSFEGGFAEVDSFIYWSKAGGGFDPTPGRLLTSGARDVEVGDLDGDSDMDLVFANSMDNALGHRVSSYVYLNEGGGSFPSSPNARLPATGASAVVVTDLDGTGYMDLVFACELDGSTREVPSLVYLGGASGWPTSPDAQLATVGATDVAVAQLVEEGSGGYLSQAIVPEDIPNTGTYHTLRCTAGLDPGKTCTLRLVDADTWEVLAETQAQAGTNEWNVAGAFRVKEHPRVRVMALFTGLDLPGEAYLADLWLNWTARAHRPPAVLDAGVAVTSLYRTVPTNLWLNVSDEYDGPWELEVVVQHRVDGTGTWDSSLLGTLAYTDGAWRTTLLPRSDAALGSYDLRATATDTDGLYSPWVEFPGAFTVLNNVPSRPQVHITPGDPLSTSTLTVELDTRSTDVETTGLTYNYTWYRDGVLVPEVSGDQVPTYLTGKGENWTVEVRAWDGDDFSDAGASSVVIGNAPPQRKDKIPDPEMDEDTPDNEWINLMNAFSDADGDPITWSVAKDPVNFTVEIDHDTGQVTITPNPDWFGEETLTFVATDGEATASQTVTVVVHSVNDIPAITHVDGEPVTGAEYSYTISQGQPITITYAYADVEGDEVQADVSIPTVDLDEEARTITFDPGTDAVGTFTFTFRLWDVVTPGQKVSISFTIEVQNENDPMDDPVINQPPVGSKYKVNQSFSLVASCFDPDIQYGQELNFSWSSNISGHLGYGSSLTVRILEPGTHSITVTVSDGEFEKSASMDVVIEPRGGTGPPPDPDGDDDGPGINWVLIVGIVVALVIIGVVLFIATRERRVEAREIKKEELQFAEETRKEEEARKAKEAREAVDTKASETAAAAAKARAAGWEAEDAGAEEYEELDMGASEGALSMQATVTEEASSDVKKLWSGIGDAPAEQTDEEKEAMRVENEKRQYQNAIGRLPYGIPSKELAGMDWVELSNILATGEKRTVEGGKEVASINGRWYYSDADDTGSFLKEHGKKKEERPAKAPASDKDKLLAKLEERFILGEISEETYKELKRKYS